SVAIVHAPRAVVVAGAPDAIARLANELRRRADADADAARDGQLGGAPLRPILEPLPVAAPFHTPALSGARNLLAQWLAGSGAADRPRLGELTVIDPLTGDRLSSDDAVLNAVLSGQCSGETLRWDRTLEALRADDPDWILDLGPGTAISRLTGELLTGTGIRTLPLASPDARRVLFSPASHQAGRDIAYAELAPTLVQLPDGTMHVDTPFTRLHGAPPIMLAGMTPTTTDAGIVAAAANAGFVAELAGGGQPDEATFTERVRELGELLEPGREALFNTLLLDRHLWDLHVDGAGLVLKARATGAPLGGLTISAGVPDVEAAVRLLDELAVAGLHRNAFKPGTVEQIRQVLAIARAAPHHTIMMQVEGGQGGGHHSWLELEHLLLETYAEIRRRENVVLAVGGGIGTPQRAADLLTGRWSLLRGEPVPMPVDAVLIGTAAMACAEATASPQVKAALVAATGTPDWVPRNGVAGGVTSATSSLNADIHLLENAAARAGKLLQTVAGDEAAVQERREEIIAALAQTAKPYLGDLDTMTYGEVLAALTRHMATGRGGRYDDGAWGHPSWRARVLELARHFAARLDDAQTGAIEPPLAVSSDLDDPDAALARFAARYPQAATTLLHPADRDLVLELCDRPGKPVPFVPVLDGEVRRWYMADALWQAQDDRLAFDEVFVIPGPVAVGGIERANEPIAELLQRFHQGTIDALRDRDAPIARRDRLATHGAAPQPLAAIAAAHDGPLAALLAAPQLLTSDGPVANPLWSLVRPGDLIELDAEPHDAERTPRLTRLQSTPPAALPGEQVELTIGGDGALLQIAIPQPGGVRHQEAPTLRVALTPHGAGWAAPDLHASRTAFATRALRGSRPHADADPARWNCPPELPAAYRRTTGAGVAAPPPIDLAFTLAWPSIVALLTGDAHLAPHLSELVHAEHGVTLGAGWSSIAGSDGPASARISAIDDRDGAASAVTVIADLRTDDGELAATVTARLVFASPRRLTVHRTLRDEPVDTTLTLDAATAEVLRDKLLTTGQLITAAGDWTPKPGDRLHLRARLRTTISHDAPQQAQHTGEGSITRDGQTVATLTSGAPQHEPAGRGTPPRHPLARLLRVLEPRPAPAQPLDRAPLGALEDAAPLDLTTFALVGGDHNPLHRSVLAARLAGLERPIVHGLWLAARASAAIVELAAPQAPHALRDWRMQFLAPVDLGAVLRFDVRAGSRRDGRRTVEVEVLSGETPVARGTAEIDLALAGARALLFPGQGIQRAGMVEPVLAGSRAARAVWRAADAHARAALGVPLARIAQDNPKSLRLAGGHVVHHPAGLLMRTEYTQPALVALAAAQLAALREAGQLPEHGGVPVAAGHSVGEFSALHALGVLSVEQAVTLTYRRGEAMQRHVPRDAQGRSPYRMAVADPQAMGVTHDTLAAAVREHAPAAEIVNENARDRQYSIVGPTDQLDALAAAYPGSRRPAVRLLDGIDVPFHSSVLRPAASELLAILDAEIGAIDRSLIVGRWVPNLTGRPFALDDASASAIVQAAALPGRTLAELPPLSAPDDRARWLLLTALA
ncbi:MAG: DUF1729 domain-containing protein, partial [Patulibacter sp.]